MTAPTSAPATYEQALVAAEALVASRGAASADPIGALTTAADQITATRGTVATWAKTAIRGLWAAVDPYSPAQVKVFTEQAAGIMESAQTAVAQVAAVGTQHSLASMGVVIDAAPSNPLDVRAPTAIVRRGRLVLQRGASSVNYDGARSAQSVSRADMTTQGIFNRPGALYRWAQSQGKQDANSLALERIDDLVDANLMLSQRFASQEMLARAAKLDDIGASRGRRGMKVIGYRRVIHPEMSKGGTCGMCIAASDRIYHVSKLMPIHGGCHCTVAAITEDHDPADDLNAIDLGQFYKQAGGNTAAHLKRTRYKVDDHGELGAVLVPQKAYNPRSAQGKRSAAAVAPSAPESKGDIAARHLPILEKNLEALRAAGAGEQSPKVQYHLQQIDRLRRDLAA